MVVLLEAEGQKRATVSAGAETKLAPACVLRGASKLGSAQLYNMATPGLGTEVGAVQRNEKRARGSSHQRACEGEARMRSPFLSIIHPVMLGTLRSMSGGGVAKCSPDGGTPYCALLDYNGQPSGCFCASYTTEIP